MKHLFILCTLSVPFLLGGCIDIGISPPEQQATRHYDIGTPSAARDRIAPIKLSRRIEFRVTGNLTTSLMVRDPSAAPGEYQVEIDDAFRWRMSPMELLRNYLTAYLNTATTRVENDKSISLIDADAKLAIVTINLTAFELNRMTRGGAVEGSYIISDPSDLRDGGFHILATGNIQGWSNAQGQAGTVNPGEALAGAARSFARQLCQELTTIP